MYYIIIILPTLHCFLISCIVFSIVCDTLLSMTEEKGDIPPVPRSLLLVGLSWGNCNLVQ